MTGADVDLAPMPGMLGRAWAAPFSARDRVRFVGEPVAVVLAESPGRARTRPSW